MSSPDRDDLGVTQPDSPGFKDLYAVLGLPLTAPPAQIRSRGESLCRSSEKGWEVPLSGRLAHYSSPTGRSTSPIDDADAGGRIDAQDVRDAMRVLGDPRTRKAYDSRYRQVRHGVAPPTAPAFDEDGV